VLTAAQLRTIGLSSRAVGHRVAAGRLHRVHRVHRFAVERPSRMGRWMAAVLAMGEDAALSHRSAAALWRPMDDRHALTDVTVPHCKARSRPGIEIHSGTTLAANDLAIHGGIPCTALPRTLLDLAASVDRRTLDRAIGRAEELRIFDLTAIQELLGRSGGSLALAGYETRRYAADEVFQAPDRVAAEVRAFLGPPSR
jgi:hypothetical protein